MANEVEITLKVVDKASPEIEKVTERLQKWAVAFVQANPEISKSREEMEKLIATMKEHGRQTGMQEEVLKALGDETKELTEDQKEATKSTGDFVKQLTQIGKGLVGVSGLFMLGRAMKSFVTDAIDAAREAGELPKVFDEAADAADRLQVAMGARMARTFAPIVETQKNINESILKQLENEEKINQALQQGLITREEANITGVSELKRSEDVLQTLELINEREQERLELIEAQREVREQDRRPRDDDAQRTRAALQETKEAVEEIAALTPIDFFADVDVDIASKIRAVMREIEFVQLGFTETVQQAEDLIALLSDPTVFVSPETVQTMLGDLAEQAELEAIALDYETGEIDLTEAKEEIQDKVGGSLAEAEIILMNIISGLNELDNRRIQIFIDWQGDIPTIPGGGGDDPIDIPDDPTGGGGWSFPPPVGGDGPSFGIGTIVVQSPGDALDMVDALVEALS